MANKPYYPAQQVPDPVYAKEKSEDYNLLGGINSKVSLYTNGPAQFRDISNLNFINTGSLTKRPGTTLFGGITLATVNASPAITSGFEFSKLSGTSYLLTVSDGFMRTNTPTQTGLATKFLSSSITFCIVAPGSLFSFSPFVDRAFACDGNVFFRFNNQNATQANGLLFSLPPGSSYGVVGTTGLAGNATTGLSGSFVLGFSFVNDRGYIGPPSFGTTLLSTTLGSTTAVQFTIGNCNILTQFYGVTAIQLYRSEIDGVILTQSTLAPISFAGNTTILYDLGSTLLDTAAVAPNTFYLPGSGQTMSGVSYLPFIPRYTEVFNNQLFMAGFSTAPSTFWWSQIGEPEGVEPEFSTEVRSNDGDVISGMKSYLGSLIITKRKSIHLLSGSDPTNFLLQELSDQYGCVSHRAIVPWNNVVWFLDSKGIIEFNGANIQCVSTPIEPIFNLMNIKAAYDNACGIHVKKFNELWFSIPANGSTINNQIIVYDYVAHSWTHYDGVQAQCLFNAFAGFPNLTPFAGNYTGGLVYFHPSLTSDNDQGITCSFDSIFFSARGQTTENMYRRFYLNVDPIMGFTQPINMTFKTNFGSTIQLSRTMYQAPYQSRIDFGLSARSIQASMYHYSASLPLKINGFTVESRFQRGV